MRPVPFKGNLIVTNLPPDMTAPRLADLFESYGIVIGAEIRQIPANSGTATIGVVALAPETAVDRAIDAVNRSMIGERKVKVGRAKPLPPRPARAQAAKPALALAPAPHPASPAAPRSEPVRPERTVIVEYKPRRRVIP